MKNRLLKAVTFIEPQVLNFLQVLNTCMNKTEDLHRVQRINPKPHFSEEKPQLPSYSMVRLSKLYKLKLKKHCFQFNQQHCYVQRNQLGKGRKYFSL